jgi:hypothetical protein
MHWVRKNSLFGSWAALFALGIQLVLSFGHSHFENVQRSPSAIAAILLAQTDGTDDTAPTDDHRGNAGHDACAICAALSLTASSVLPTISLLATPLDHFHEWLTDFHAAQISLGLHFLFQARAPPRSI